jgi:hypothetical protein
MDVLSYKTAKRNSPSREKSLESLLFELTRAPSGASKLVSTKRHEDPSHKPPAPSEGCEIEKANWLHFRSLLVTLYFNVPILPHIGII